ncbi:MAG: sigma-70 family RNA polymerase sigma factor [Bacteroidota bacterium]
MLAGQQHPDQQYLEGMVNGDPQVLQRIYARYFPFVATYVRQNKGQRADAEDLFATSLEIIYLQARDGLQIRQSFGAYLKLICQRRWLNRLSKAQRTVLDLDNQPEPSLAAEVVTQLEEQERKLLFRKHFAQLPERCRQILELTFADKNYREVAEALALNYSFVRRRGGECVEKLMQNIQQDPLFQELK